MNEKSLDFARVKVPRWLFERIHDRLYDGGELLSFYVEDHERFEWETCMYDNALERSSRKDMTNKRL